MPTTDANDLEATCELLLALPVEDRLALGERLLASVPEGGEGSDLAQTVRRRMREIDDGTVVPIPKDVVIQQVLESLKKRRDGS